MKNAKAIQPIFFNKVTLMKISFFIIVMFFFVLLPASAQSPGSAAWDKGEREMLLGLTLYVRPNVVDIGSTVNEFFYSADKPFTAEAPVKQSKGKYTIRCIVGSEYNDEKVYVTVTLLRTSASDAYIPSILIEGTRASTGTWGQSTAATFEEKMFVFMNYFMD